MYYSYLLAILRVLCFIHFFYIPKFDKDEWQVYLSNIPLKILISYLMEHNK